MEIRIWRAGRLPGIISTRFDRTFHAEKIYPPYGRRIEIGRQRLYWNRQLGSPGLTFFTQVNRALHAALEVGAASGKDIQIDPHAIRADFKFLIVARLRWIGLQENFRNIPVPKLLVAAIRIRIFEHKQFAVTAFETQIQKVCATTTREPEFRARDRGSLPASPGESRRPAPAPTAAEGCSASSGISRSRGAATISELPGMTLFMEIIFMPRIHGASSEYLREIV